MAASDFMDFMVQGSRAKALEEMARKRLTQYDEISAFLYYYDPAVEDADAGPEFIAGAEMVMERIRKIITPEEEQHDD
jgi:hypothetical protein